MTPLPPLSQKITGGAAGGLEFERLLVQLLLRHAEKCGYVFEPTHGAGGDRGLDGVVREGGVPGLSGPVGFQFKFHWDFEPGAAKSSGKRSKAADALARSQEHWPEMRHFILVTPHEFKESETKWLHSLPVRPGLTVHHWGEANIERFFALAPELYARYYPQEARPLLPGYDGFDFGAFANDYCQRLALECGRLRTLGLPPETLREDDAAREIQLRDVFVPLTLVPSDGAGRRPLHEYLNRRQSLVVLGDPGSGKTTLLTFLALLHSGAAELEGFLPEAARKRVPFIVPLRNYVLELKKQPGIDVIDFLAMRARTDFTLPRAHRAFFESTLRMGEAIVLFDGLDEAGGLAQRRHMAQIVRSFHQEFSGCPVWVTSRKTGGNSMKSVSKCCSRPGRKRGGKARVRGTNLRNWGCTYIASKTIWPISPCTCSSSEPQAKLDERPPG
jgi:energy-coupling factor transporter ATP-binding protein EcfA2